MRKTATTLFCLLALATVGCVQELKLISLNRDGSGQIVHNTYLSPMLAGMMDDMEATSGNFILNEEDALKAASELGEGVRFVSLTPVSRPDGFKGSRTLFEFDDINKVVLSLNMDNLETDKPPPSVDQEASPDEETAKKDENPIRFEYTEGKLVIHMPRESAVASQDAPEVRKDIEGMDAMDQQMEEMGKQMMQGMLPMMRGMRMRFVIKVPDEIRKTNANFVVTDPETGGRQYVNLVDFNIDKLLDSPEGIDVFMKLQHQDEESALKMLSNAGLQVETEKKITIEF